MWGYPLWSFAPLAVLMFWPPALEPAQLRRFAAAALAVLIAFPIGFAVAELGEPLIRDRPKATQFPGRLLADTITRQWREKTGTPLAYVGGARIIADAADRVRPWAPASSPPTTWRSIRRTGRTSSSTANSRSAPGSTPPTSTGGARSWCGSRRATAGNAREHQARVPAGRTAAAAVPAAADAVPAAARTSSTTPSSRPAPDRGAAAGSTRHEPGTGRPEIACAGAGAS